MASDYLLEIDGIKGESKVLRGAVDVFSWSFGASRPASVGGQQGAIKFEPIAFVKVSDKASPTLALTCATGKHIPKAVLHVRKSGATQDYYVITMSEVLISSFSTSGDADDRPTEEVAFSYGTVEIQYSTVTSGPISTTPAP